MLSRITILVISGLLMVALVTPAAMASNGNGNGPDHGRGRGPDVSQQSQTASACQPAGDTGLTAHYVNEAPDGSLDVTCDIGIYFDEDGEIAGAQVNGTADGAKDPQYGIYIDGADVDISRSTISVAADFPHRFISVSYHDGASGTVRNSEVSGAHRVGVLVRGEDTDVTILGNRVAGTGARPSGWAENGIQVDQGARAEIRNNTVSDHWWDGESNFGSTGILIWSEPASRIVGNELTDNEFSIYVLGDGNRVTGNRVSSTVESQSSLDFKAYGVLIAGSDNHLAGNRFSSDDGAVGIYLFAGSADNQLNGNRISGFAMPILDGGDDTRARGNPTLSEDGVEVVAHPVH